MMIHSFDNDKQWSLYVTEWLETHVNKFQVRRVFLPAGETPRPLYEFWEQAKPQFLKALTFVQVDEIINEQNFFQNFFLQTLPSFSQQFEWIGDAEQGAELALLGLGTNGHVAFHEPGIHQDFFSGCVELHDDTCGRLQLPSGAHGLTYGLGAFLRCHSILLLLRGENKKSILQRVISQDPALPASHLMQHKDLTIVTNFKV